MEQVIIFGAGPTGRDTAELLKRNYKVLFFCDNNTKLQGTTVDGIPVLPPAEISSINYDAIFICTTSAMDEVFNQLLDLGVKRSSIKRDAVLTRVRARENFIRSLAVEQISMPGSIAEAGVYRGEFSKHISRAYPDRKFYLFDTFSGFPQNDMRTERLFNNTPFMEQRNFCETDVELVRSKLVNPEKAVFCVGEFPESAQNIKDRYCFVSIDMDLYEPTYQALIFFYPCMVDGGVILLHDYYGEAFPNVRRAVNDFEVKLGVRLAKLPIGDDCSLAILKTVV